MVVEEYLRENGKCPFRDWFLKLDGAAARRVRTATIRLEQGNFSSVKGVGAGVFEIKINFGPGYRIYFGKDGSEIVILLGGGTKKRQNKDIEEAKTLWREFKARKKCQ